MSPNPFDDLSVFSVVLFLAIAGLTAYFARFKGRNPVAWFLIALLIGFFAPIILMFLPRLGPDGQPIISDLDPTMTVLKPDAPDDEQSVFPSPLLDRQEGEDKLWYYMDQAHQQVGPVSVIALREQWHTGRLELNSYVWTEGMVDWKKIDELPELKLILNKMNVL
jgi:GYF domain 2